MNVKVKVPIKKCDSCNSLDTKLYQRYDGAIQTLCNGHAEQTRVWFKSNTLEEVPCIQCGRYEDGSDHKHFLRNEALMVMNLDDKTREIVVLRERAKRGE